MGFFEPLDALDRRVFGAEPLRLIYRWVLPGFILAVAVAGIAFDLSDNRAADVVLVLLACMLLIVGPPNSKRRHR